ncbi:MAG: hypothetical protein HYV28_05280 [Ignavibacteriales bacterium]|nr:hypothetical protein [Ignavibacteriales bacterium]
MKYLHGLLLVLFLFAGCTPQPTVFSNSYKKADLTGRNVYLAPINIDSIAIKNKDDVEDDFGADTSRAASVIRDSMYNAYAKKVKSLLSRDKISVSIPDFSLFDSLNYSTDFENVNLQGNSVTTWQGSQKVVVAKECPYLILKKEWLAKHGISQDIVITIQKLTFSREAGSMYFPHQYPGQNIKVPGGTINIPGPRFLQSGVPSISPAANMLSAPAAPSGEVGLVCTCRFIIYDYKENKYITYGTVTVAASFLMAMTRETWKTVFENLAQEIIYSSPLKPEPVIKPRF